MDNNDISITDNFLAKREFDILRTELLQFDFPWFFNPTIVSTEKNNSPGVFIHKVHENSENYSPFYDVLKNSRMLEQLRAAVLLRININLNPRNKEPYFADYHIDAPSLGEKAAAQWITSIFYVNTNNGYTELESGEIIESVANRMVSFPLNTRHRGVTQTDEQRRLVINLNYFKFSA